MSLDVHEAREDSALRVPVRSLLFRLIDVCHPEIPHVWLDFKQANWIVGRSPSQEDRMSRFAVTNSFHTSFLHLLMILPNLV